MDIDQLRKWINDARVRSVLAGGLGGFAGWLAAELFVGKPSHFWETVLSGLFCGVGIAATLAVAEGVFITSWSLVRRGLLAGVALGALGGLIGAAFGQVTYSVASVLTGSREEAKPDSVFAPDFSPEVRARIEEAGGQAGEIEIALIWRNTNDLDLHVVDPSGEEIYYRDKRSRSGGWLDVDRNAGCSDVTREPIEHVRWAEGSAPDGDYAVYVNHYARCASEDPTAFRVEIKNGSQVTPFEESISHGEPKKLIHRFQRDSTPPEPVPTVARGPGLFAIFALIVGWGIFGALVGCAEGVTRRSRTAVRNAGIGGAIGGAVGGLALIVVLAALASGVTDEETAARASAATHGGWFGRMLGFVILGACIGLWIVLIERALSAVISVRSGRYEGREIFLDKEEMRLGRNETLEVFLGGDGEIAAHHATIRQDGGVHLLLAVEGRTLVNGSAVTRHPLSNGDTIVLGKTRLVYRHKAARQGAGPGSGDDRPGTRTSAVAPRSPTPPPPPPPPPKKKT